MTDMTSTTGKDTSNIHSTIAETLAHFDIPQSLSGANIAGNDTLEVYTPADGTLLARVTTNTCADAHAAIKNAQNCFVHWATTPPPKRGDLIRLLGEELRKEKEALGSLVTLECGKIYQEGLGEVQEMIDICDFAVGLSRQLYGLTIASERPGHAMRETWHPIGPCGVITAFNFPVAVWSWNTALSIICGNPVIWKPSEKTPLTALACQKLFTRALSRFNETHGTEQDHASTRNQNLLQVLIGGKNLGQTLVDSPSVPLISATGSTAMGREVGQCVAKRFGKSILELGGNNAMIITKNADLEMAVRAITFSAVGTCGQRCTTLRRLIVHKDIYDTLLPRLQKIYGNIQIGNPLSPDTLVGPIIDKSAFEAVQSALTDAKKQGGTIHGGERVMEDLYPDAYYLRPAIAEMPEQCDIVKQETFGPILYVMPYDHLDEAIAIQNNVPQGLSSCIFTTDLREAEYFLSAAGSDCGIANVNIGPSGAEIGGAFGGEKETGGGRESGSDAWKGYMRRQTNTINFSSTLPLAQGISFDIDTD